MTEILLVRHGETDWNKQEIFRGRADIDLNATGRRQAELLSQYLKDVKFAAILTSPLERALKTAQIIATGHYRVPVEPVMDLIDIDFGNWQSLSHAEVKEKYTDLYRRWLQEPQRVKFPGGESLSDVRKRALKVINNAVTRYEGTVVLVSHRVINKVIILGLLGLGNSHFWDIKLDTCGITLFNYENGCYILTRHNDTSFLEPLTKTSSSDF
jgi:broad specificity phosphatase PhoE